MPTHCLLGVSRNVHYKVNTDKDVNYNYGKAIKTAISN